MPRFDSAFKKANDSLVDLQNILSMAQYPSYPCACVQKALKALGEARRAMEKS